MRASDITAAADSAYQGKNYVDAARLYQAEVDSVGPTSDLYYNIGNCYYRTGSQGRAVLYYERSLKLNPRNRDARANLDFINSRLTDRPGERGTFLGNVCDKISSYLSPDAWAILGVIAFVLVAIGVLLYFFVESVGLRKIGFFGGGLMVVVTVLSIVFGLRAASIMTATDRAVVIVPSTILSTAPRVPSSAAEEAFMLHEGAVVTVLDEVKVSEGKTWLRVEFDNTHIAWIESEVTARI